MPPGSPLFTVRDGVLFRVLPDGAEIAHADYLNLPRRERRRLDRVPHAGSDSEEDETD